MQATILNGIMGYNQYTDPDTVTVELAVEPSFVAFLFLLADICPYPLVPWVPETFLARFPVFVKSL